MLAYANISPDLCKSLKVKPHSVRSVATSLGAIKATSLDSILKVGLWSSSNSFIKHYITDFSTDTLSGLSRLSGFVAGGEIF